MAGLVMFMVLLSVLYHLALEIPRNVQPSPAKLSAGSLVSLPGCYFDFQKICTAGQNRLQLAGWKICSTWRWNITYEFRIGSLSEACTINIHTYICRERKRDIGTESNMNKCQINDSNFREPEGFSIYEVMCTGRILHVTELSSWDTFCPGVNMLHCEDIVILLSEKTVYRQHSHNLAIRVDGPTVTRKNKEHTASAFPQHIDAPHTHTAPKQTGGGGVACSWLAHAAGGSAMKAGSARACP